jgi:hypothetical protein
MMRFTQRTGNCIGVAVIVAGFLYGVLAEVAPTDAVADTKPWATKAVPHTNLTVEYPSNWKLYKQPSRGSGATVALVTGDPSSRGDSLRVLIYTGKDATWPSDLAEYQEGVEQSARFGDGEVVGSAAAGSVGTMPAYSHLMSYERGMVPVRLGRKAYKLRHDPVVFGHLEVLQANDVVVTFGVTADPGELDRGHEIINSVKAG